MPTSLSFERHVAIAEAAGARLAALVAEAGLGAAVPTCPAWDARALMAHQAMVHRWSTAQITGAAPEAVPNQTALRERPDLTDYYDQSLALLLAALRAAPPDLTAMTFLNDAPPPRHFWARRQAHETTMHAVDALAAVLGRTPTAAEADIEPEVAVDGLDELLRGFFTRGRSKLFDGAEYTFVVAPSDSPRRWVVRVAERLTVDPGDDATPPSDAAAELRGTAAQLYLGLWNRGDEMDVRGDADVAARWRTTQRVTWS